MIGVNGRGQNVLKWLGVMNRLDEQAITVLGRKDWSPETKIEEASETLTVIGRDKSYYTKCISRDQLAAILYDEINAKYRDKVKVHFNVECTDVSWENENEPSEMCHLTLSQNNQAAFTDSSDFVIGADGGNSKIRDVMEERGENNFKVKRYEDKNVRVYKTIPLNIPSKKFLNYSARTKSDVNIDALPIKQDLYLGVVLFR